MIERMFKDLESMMETDKLVIPYGMKLYRASKRLEEKPIPRKCSDTDKVGVYFSANDPYLSETMCSEYNDDLIVAEYMLIHPVIVYVGKYSCKSYGWSNIPHIDNEVVGMYSTCEPKNKYAEVFLTPELLKHVKYLRSYTMTVKDSMQKWGYYKW